MHRGGTSLASPSRLAFTTRVIAPMATLVILAIVLVFGFVVFSAHEQNRLEIESSSKLAETALVVNQRQLGRNLKDYAVWEDVYRNLHVRLDISWAATDGNVSANIFEGLWYEMAFVVAPDGDTVYSVIEGVPKTTADAFALLPSGLDDLIAAGVVGDVPAVGLLRSGDAIFLVAAAAILPPSIDPVSLPASERSVLIFAKELNEDFLTRMSGEYLLRDLAIELADAAPPAQAAGASIPLTGPDSTSLGRLRWTPQQPGFELLRMVLPPLVIATLVLVAFAWLVVGNARRSALAIQESARTVEAFAQTLQESEARFRDVAEASSDWIWECDPDRRLVYLSARFSEVTGIAAASILGKPLEQFFTQDDGASDWAALLPSTSDAPTFRNLRCSYSDAAGRPRVCRLAGRPIVDAAGALVGCRGTATDITEEVEAQAQARHLALHDALTQLPNRIVFSDRLHVALQGHHPDHHPISVLCLDLDHFKEVNDTLGHGAGDVLLQQLAVRLRTCLRAEDTVARLGGDEFAIIQIGVEQPASADALSARIIEVVRQPFLVEGHELHVGVTVGVALSGGAHDSPERLLRNADIALYRAKQASRGTTRFFETAMDDELRARKALEHDLRQAIARDEFEVHYQPVINLATETVTGVEALLRWHHPERGLVSPIDFIPLAEATGQIIAIGEWVLRTACAQAQSWPGITVAVNLSPVQFRNADLVNMVRGVLEETGLDPSRLELEITESVLIKDTDAALVTLNQLKRIGARIALDDFGTGYSSLGYLNAFPFDKLKIDRSFVANLGDGGKSNAIVRSVISLGASLDMTITAEGVETREQAAFLRREGCRQVQGYLFGHPVRADVITDLLRQAGTGHPLASQDAA